MLFRSTKGHMVNITRSDYASDSSYYRDIMYITGCESCKRSTSNDIIDQLKAYVKKQL